MNKLKQALEKIVSTSKNSALLKNELGKGNIEHIFIALRDEGLISLEQYRTMRSDFNNRNKYLDILKITAPTTFGQKWAQGHIKEICPEIRDPKEYKIKTKGAFDLIYPFQKDQYLKIEAKAGRSVDKNRSELPYHERAWSVTDKNAQFDMNFQQMKPSCFDIVIMIGVWSDKIRYWVMSSKNISKNKFFSTGQHRGNKGYEGQLHITSENIDYFKDFEVSSNGIASRIKKLSNIK